MGRGWLYAVCGALVVVWLALNRRLPPGISEPWKVRAIQAGLRVNTAVSFLAETFGFCSRLNATRVFIEMLFSKAHRDPRVEITDDKFDGVGVRIYRPTASSNLPLPVLVYFHGGGWCTFTAYSYDGLASLLSGEAGIVVVSVNYRLAPEFPYPVPFQDCLDATLHLINNAWQYGVDKTQIGIAGDSAGGNLAAAVVLKLAEIKNSPPIRFQGLFYPALQSFDFRTPSYSKNDQATPEILSSNKMATFWLWYFQGHLEGIESVLNNRHISGELKWSKSERYMYVSQELLPQHYRTYSYNSQRNSHVSDYKVAQSLEKFIVDKFANPLMAESLRDQPPAFVVTAEFDVLRDDGFMYVRRLKKDDNYIQHLHYRSGYHGFLSLTNSRLEPLLARKTVTEFVKFIRMVFSAESASLQNKYVYSEEF